MRGKIIVIGISASGKIILNFEKNYLNQIIKLILEGATTYETWPNLSTKIATLIPFEKSNQINNSW